ncbi:MAG: GNAT family N-acetyltransferase [Actinomycetota bacterium]|nr:GNAT family N-acetyltransferase [Actinomycetota bacterium]MDQ6948513.1 GNAT family N-acetyltransferase [Actinomycetota bacterium]
MPVIETVQARDPGVLALLDALTSELALAGYSADQTFGYSLQQLEQGRVHLVGARVGGQLVAVGGVELHADGSGELKRFYVVPHHRGTGVADAVIAALVAHARQRRTEVLRLETGDKQQAAISFYRRHGFVEIPRFGAYVNSATSVCMKRDLT